MFPIGESLTILQSVDSTNNYAMALASNGLAKHGDAFFALSQTAGKGQRGKTWKTNPGENIILTVLMVPKDLPTTKQFAFNMVVALACYDFFSAYAGDDTKIKWPNDIYWRDRKAGGILIENIIKGGQWHFAITGMGININQTSFPDGVANAVSLKQITGKDWDTTELVHALCSSLQKRYESGIGGILDEYNAALYKKNEKVKFRKGGRVFDATVKSVTANGKLLIETFTEEELEWGEAEWIIGG